MFSKIALLALLVASVSASGGFSSFSYGVSDPNTGDIKDQHEKRVGGNVVGKYSLLESDGTKRVVEYSADDATGFKAVVHKEPAVGGAIGAPLGGGLAHGLAGGHLAHSGLATGSLAGAHANPWAASAALGHAGALAGFGAASPLAYGNTGHYGQAGLYGNSGIYGQAGLHGQSGLYGHGNPLAGSLGAAGYGTPTVSSYSHRIVHNGPDAFPYGRYGQGGYGAHGAALGGAQFAGAHLAGANPWANAAGSANPWANNAASANPWANNAIPAHGNLGARGLGYNSQLGW